MNAVVAHVEPQGVIADMAARYGMNSQAFESTLRATIMPKDCSKEQTAAFLIVAKLHDLNPFTKEIFAFPARGGIQAIVSVDGWMKLINSHPQFDGMEFYDHHDESGKLISIQCRMFRKDRTHPVEVTEYMSECYRDTDTWKRWPARMLRHKATIQASRYAFGFAGIMEPDEVERMADVTVLQQPWSELTTEQKEERKRQQCAEAAHEFKAAVEAIKAGIQSADESEEELGKQEYLRDVAGIWNALPQEAQIALYACAPTKGGIFTTHERDVIHNKLPRAEA